MKHLLLTTIAAVVLVGCGPSKNEHLVWAAQRGDMDDVRYYLDAGADPNARDVSLGIFETPLHHAAVMDWRNMAELLIEKGADVNAKDDWLEQTPLHRAAEKGHNEIAELLIDKGADVNAQDEDGKTPLDSAIKYKQTETADLLRKHGGKTAEESIHIAAEGGYIYGVKQHLAAGTDVNAKDDDGKTPLDSAIKYKQTETADLLRQHGGKTGEELKAEGK